MSQSGTPDREWVDQAKAGDRKAFAKLVEKYQKRVYAVAFGMLHNRDDALDVVQDAFVKVHKHIGAFQGNASFYTWLYRIVANLCIDVRRKRGRRPEVAFEEGIERDDVVSEGIDVAPRNNEANPAKNIARKELAGEIDKALAVLSENHRIILLLREVEGLSYEELASVLKISKGTVMSRLFHARKNMQKELRPYLGLEEGQGLSGAEAEDSQDKQGTDKQERNEKEPVEAAT